MADVAAVTVQALAEVTAGAFTGSAVDLGERRTAIKARLRVTGCTAAFRVGLETSDNGTDGWRDAGIALPFTNAPSQHLAALHGLDRYVRTEGEASANTTFELTAEAHQLYCDAGDLTLKLSAELITRINRAEPGAVARALIAASADMESALAVQHPLPLTTVPEIVRDKTADLAAYRVLGRLIAASQGSVCSAPSDQTIVLITANHKDAQTWLTDARKRIVLPFGAVPAPNVPHKVSSGNPDYPDTYPKKFSDGWGDFG